MAPYGDGLDLAFDLPVPLDADFADPLQVELAIAPDAAAVTVGGESERVVAVPGLEARESRLASGLEPSEEGLERLVEAPEDVLAGAVVGGCLGAGLAQVLEVACLVEVAQRGPLAFPCDAAL